MYIDTLGIPPESYFVNSRFAQALLTLHFELSTYVNYAESQLWLWYYIGIKIA
jgi:hypothetical protein